MSEIESMPDVAGVPKTKKGGFFILDLNVVDDMVRKGAGAKEVATYLVMVRGGGKKEVSTHGANSVSNRIGMTHYQAEKALAWLAEEGYIVAAEPYEGVVKKRQVRWRVVAFQDSLEVPLANALLDGIGKGKDNPPLARIFEQVRMSNHCVFADARLDCIMVLLHFYRHHLLAECGGVDPRAGIYRSWVATENSDGNKVLDIEGTRLSLHEIEGREDVMQLKLAEETLFYISESEERNLRFWDAFHNLRNLGFIYEVVQVWSADPITHKRAEPLYTLYVRDYHARQTEPYLQTQIHKLALRLRYLDPHTEFSHIGRGEEIPDEFANILDSGKFRFIAPTKTGGFPIGIYRLRFRPGTRDTSIGIREENLRVAQWSKRLE